MIFPSFEPPPDRGQIGVGQPLSVIFDQPPADRAAAERALSVTTVPAVEGSWSWVDDRTVHSRPREYWPAGTQKRPKDRRFRCADAPGPCCGSLTSSVAVCVCCKTPWCQHPPVDGATTKAANHT
ncbi:hypothetical protein GCM10011594_44200 [Nakamurella endophytica]|uniref:Bacterial Ig domain-containing protein n=1 Tax=Nakamurella endophytica TaxID=1748367 RepID=A0A917TE35_9ACTN|nr:hypothetical protein GCM10011594_44200 [Nakamurella endophytica]